MDPSATEPIAHIRNHRLGRAARAIAATTLTGFLVLAAQAPGWAGPIGAF